MDILTKSNHRFSSKGFTLIELCIVILIVGILILPLLEYYNQYREQRKLEITKENVNLSISAMSSPLGRYPCPTDRALPSTDPNYSTENCVLASIKLCSDSTKSGICKVELPVDKDEDRFNDFILIGGVPTKGYTSYHPLTLLPTSAPVAISKLVNNTTIVDGWNNKLTYAVSYTLSNPKRVNSFSDFKLGSIAAVDEFERATAGINNDGQFVVLSHGKNGSGAYSKEGTLIPCPTGTRETENCNDDEKFMQAIGSYDGAGATQYDDYVKFYTVAAGELWRNIVNAGETTPHIINMNTQNVGVNLTGPPTTKLEVGGTIKSSTVRTDNICGPTPGVSDCFSSTIANAWPATDGTLNYSAGYCGDGQIVLEISKGKLKCGYPSFKAANPGQSPTCDAGKYVISILTDGCIYCSDGKKKCTTP